MKLSRHGFTLLELVIVLAILSLLVLLSSPIYKEYQDEANRRVLQQNLGAMRQAIDRYQAKYLKSPKKLIDLIPMGVIAIPRDPVYGASEYQLRVATKSLVYLWAISETDSRILTWGFDNLRSLATDARDL